MLLLRDVFEYEYPEIASIIGTSPENARQLASRARRHVTERRPRFEASRDDLRTLVRRFLAAVDHGDVASLEQMLAQDVVLHGDGGGKVPAVLRPCAVETTRSGRWPRGGGREWPAGQWLASWR